MNSIGKFARFSLHTALSPVLKDGAQRNLVVSSAMTGLKGVGFYWFLTVIGLDPSPLLAVFGMFGAAVGFAGKDMVSNFISGATLAASNTFKKGDTITVGSSAPGTLIDMDMKYLYLEKDDGTLLLIPNSSVVTSVVSIVGGAGRKRAEVDNYTHSGREAKEDADGLSEDGQTRRGRRILYGTFVVAPTLALLFTGMCLVTGLITPDDIKRQLRRGEKVAVETSTTSVDKISQIVNRMQSSLMPATVAAAHAEAEKKKREQEAKK